MDITEISRTDQPGSGIDASAQNAPAGRAANAVQHGLTAKKYIPAILRPGRVAAWVEELERELRPESVIERLLVLEIARHAAMLELAEQAEGAVLRIGVESLAPMLASAEGDLPEDSALAASVTSDAIDRLTRYRRAHEKAVHQAMDRLRERQAARRTQVGSQPGNPRDRFLSEAACRAQLRTRFEVDTWRCPRCQHRHGCFLEKSEKWQCASCRAQVGLRFGTLFARSPLPLITWFTAIGHVLANPDISAAELGRMLSLGRPATAQTVLTRIRQAIDAGGAALAGIDRHFQDSRAGVAAPSVLFSPKLRNEHADDTRPAGRKLRDP